MTSEAFSHNKSKQLTLFVSGVLLCALHDMGCFCAYDSINDSDGRTIFEAVQSVDPKRAEKVGEDNSADTSYGVL